AGFGGHGAAHRVRGGSGKGQPESGLPGAASRPPGATGLLGLAAGCEDGRADHTAESAHYDDAGNVVGGRGTRSQSPHRPRSGCVRSGGGETGHQDNLRAPDYGGDVVILDLSLFIVALSTVLLG